MEGVIRSFVPEKRYGFIEGHDRKSYFFHIEDLNRSAHSTDVQEGLLVSFDPTPGPKGLRARRLRVEHAQARMWVPPREFIFSKEDAPRRGTVFFKAPPVEFRSEKGESIDAGKERLIAYAKEIGANAVLNVHYRRDEASIGNYTYSVHCYAGCLAVVMDTRQTTDSRLSRGSEEDAMVDAEQVRRQLVALAEKRTLMEERLRRIKRRRIVSRLICFPVTCWLAATYFGAVLFVPFVLTELFTRLFVRYPTTQGQRDLASSVQLVGAQTSVQWHAAVVGESVRSPSVQTRRCAKSALCFATSLT